MKVAWLANARFVQDIQLWQIALWKQTQSGNQIIEQAVAWEINNP